MHKHAHTDTHTHTKQLGLVHEDKFKIDEGMNFAAVMNIGKYNVEVYRLLIM